MRYSIEPRDWIFVKGYGFLSFAKNTSRRLSSKYEQKLLDTTTNALKTASKRNIQKAAEATVDMVGKKIAEKGTTIASTREDQKKSTQPTKILKEIYIPPENRQ